jgi:hypothetical protein
LYQHTVFTANQIAETVFKRKSSVKNKMIRGDEEVKITLA